jgi:hypothetical protein
VPRSERKKKLLQWDVIRLPATFLGRVEAPDEQTARKLAIEQFDLRPVDEWRLILRPR